MKPKKPVLCDYCREPARLVGGIVLYPHRPDLADKKFYECRRCDAWVGCHPGTLQPLGRLANAELRAAKMAAHDAFDPIWKARHERKSAIDPTYKKGMARGGRYRKLAEAMGIPVPKCHIGMFSTEQCKQVVEICKSGVLE